MKFSFIKIPSDEAQLLWQRAAEAAASVCPEAVWCLRPAAWSRTVQSSNICALWELMTCCLMGDAAAVNNFCPRTAKPDVQGLFPLQVTHICVFLKPSKHNLVITKLTSCLRDKACVCSNRGNASWSRCKAFCMNSPPKTWGWGSSLLTLIWSELHVGSALKGRRHQSSLTWRRNSSGPL